MPFRIMATTIDVQSALTNQGYTTARAGRLDRLDRLDTTVSSRAAPGAAMDLTPGGETKVRAQIDGEFTERGYTAPRATNLDRLDTTVGSRADGAHYTATRAANLDVPISSRAAPGAAMDIVAAARTAIWNELIPATPAAGSFGDRVKANLDTTISSRAAPGAAMGLTAPFNTRLDTTVSSRADGAAYTAARANNLDRLDAHISSRAAPGATMALTPGAEAAIWNEAIPATPAAGSYGAKINSHLDVAVGSRAAPGAAMGLTAPFNTRLDTTVSSRADGAAYTAARANNLDRLDAHISSRAAPGATMDLTTTGVSKVRAQVDGEFTERGYTAVRAGNLDNLNATVSSRATPADVDTQLAGRGVSTARMAKMDMIAAQATNSGSVTAANNTAGLTVSLDTGGAAGQARAVIEVRYSCGGAATLFAEGSDDNVNWFTGDEISETAAVTNRLVGYLNAHRFFRFRSPTTGINLNFVIKALL